MNDTVFQPHVLIEVARRHGTPLFVYSKSHLESRARTLLDAAQILPQGLTPRYAAKANNHPEIVRLFDRIGLHFDASSYYEVQALLELGIRGSKISLSSQQPVNDIAEFVKSGVHYIATSLHQLEQACQADGVSEVGLRVNPGMGSGHNNRTTTGGVNSSFGLWHEYIPNALAMVQEYNVAITRLHVHVGSGADPNVWRSVMQTALNLVHTLPDVTTLDIGGGYKIRRYEGEEETDMVQVMEVFAEELRTFEASSGRKIHVEIEPGTWLVGHAGILVSTVTDIVDTGEHGHTFLRLDTGMNDIIRPSMYGARHEMAVLNQTPRQQEYVVVGHNCETGDVLTTAPHDPEGIEPRLLNSAAIGDMLAIYDTGAYCRSFAVHGYNSYPNAKELLI